MSHFTVLVIGENPEEQLQKFHEFECTGTDDEFVQDIDKTEEARENYAKDTELRYRDPDGALHDPYEDRFYREPTQDEEKKIGVMAGSGCGHGLSWTSKDWEDGRGYRTKIHFLPDGWEEVRVNTNEVQTFAEFVEDYYGYKVVLPGRRPNLTDTHKYGYVTVDKNGDVVKVVRRTNPNRKWDWYQIGGRWTGFFKVKPGVRAKKGRPGVFGNEARPGYADQLRKGDVDLDGMYADAIAEAAERYDKFENAVKGLEVPPKWSQLREVFPNDIDGARAAWREYPWVQALQKADLMPFMADVHETYFVGHENGRELYLENAKCSCLVPFALLVDGEWYEKGEMGWWGCVSNNKGTYDWAAQFLDRFEALPDDTLLTLVDCHI